MNRKPTLFRRSLLTLTAVCLTLSPLRATDLGEAIRHVGWEGIVGTWVDADTKGKAFKTTYAWKYKDKLIEINSTWGETKSTALMGFNPDTEEVYLMGANNKGGGTLGKWSMDGDDAILEVAYVTADGEKGSMKFRHHKVDADTLKITISTPDNDRTQEVTLVRAKKKAKAKK